MNCFILFYTRAYEHVFDQLEHTYLPLFHQSDEVCLFNWNKMNMIVKLSRKPSDWPFVFQVVQAPTTCSLYYLY
jgi:hypothetical protein